MAVTEFLRVPDALSGRQKKILLLLALASLTSAYVNTLFTQTVAFAADEFDVSESTQGIAAAIVRWGIVISLPLVALADRTGRRRVLVTMSWVAPIVCAAGAIAPNFAVLVATQTVGRPLGLTLEILIMVVTIEEMPRNSRAYATGLLAVASGGGAGVAVAALPLADVGPTSWRYIYVLTLVWLLVAASLVRHLPETHRFEERSRHEVVDRHLDVGRLVTISSVVFLSNMFIATASIFQNRYLKDDRDFSAMLVAVFTIATSAPASIGLVVGGRIADVRGRRIVATTLVPIGAVLLAMSFAVSGPLMWLTAVVAGLVFGTAYPAMAVYRGELFPTARRSFAGGVIMASALIGGSIGLVAGGFIIEANDSYAPTMFLMALGPVLSSVIVWKRYPETAHLELEDINPGDHVRGNSTADNQLST